VTNVVEARGLSKQYGTGASRVSALRSIDIAVERGAFVAIMGPSGCGKSTLLNVLAGLDRPTAGEVWLDGERIDELGEADLARLRRRKVGFVFQAFNLIPTLTALENITLPMDIARRPADRSWLDTVIDTMHLRDRLAHHPAELSGGQQQRVAAARALAARPEIVFADEPTGNLDSKAGDELLGFLRRAVGGFGQTIVMVTHDPAAASHADRIVFLRDGRIVDELDAPTTERVLDRMKELES
jgi:putative ABC transport system ATP-binding protein